MSQGGSDGSSDSDFGEDCCDSDSGSKTDSSGGHMPWMRRRNKESSMKIWTIAGLLIGNEGDTVEEKGVIK
jgi:hypothetical protein